MRLLAVVILSQQPLNYERQSAFTQIEKNKDKERHELKSYNFLWEILFELITNLPILSHIKTTRYIYKLINPRSLKGYIRLFKGQLGEIVVRIVASVWLGCEILETNKSIGEKGKKSYTDIDILAKCSNRKIAFEVKNVDDPNKIISDLENKIKKYKKFCRKNECQICIVFVRNKDKLSELNENKIKKYKVKIATLNSLEACIQ